MVDQQVLSSQVYLNVTYGDNPGYNIIATDGQPGWGTMYALTRALQIELGISATSNNFGAGTMSAFTSQIGSISSSTTDTRIISLLQCALWCKGYTGGIIGTGWYSLIAASVSMVRNDMGFLSAPVSVNAKMLKSLFSMDAYVLLPGGTAPIRAGQRWLNQKYSGRQDFYIIPADGLFTRQMQQGMMYALQYELGMVDGQANGNFGPGTSAGLSTQGSVQLGDLDTTKNFVRLFQLTLACNAHNVTVDGVFGAGTYSEVVAFQSFVEIQVTGNGDFGTWAALLVSTGDPSRAVSGIDTTSTMTTAFANQMRDAGYTVVGRYLTVTGKSIRPGELDTIFAYGFGLIPIFQNYNNGAVYFTTELGYEHGRQASLRARQLGLRHGVTIFFAVDYDATGDEASSIVLDYFDGVREGLNRSVSERYEIGVYGTRNVASIVYDSGRASAVWVSGMSTGYSGNLGFKMPSQWMYNQIQEVHAINIDRNAVSQRADPAARDDVLVTPLDSNDFHSFFWSMVEAEVLAEHVLSQYVEVANSYASQLVLFWLQKDVYDSISWGAYTPFPETVPGMPTSTRYGPARAQYFDEAGSRATIFASYSHGDSAAHMAATANGVYIWGDSAGQSTVEMGDLGGWGLDIVQLWAAYDVVGRPQSITSWISTELGGPETSQFGEADLLADAEGWLVGRLMKNENTTLGEALRRVLVAYPTEQLRIRAFLQLRFGAAPTTKLTSGIKSVFGGGWLWPGYPRSQFLNYGPTEIPAAEPTVTELNAFANACATRLLGIAGL